MTCSYPVYLKTAQMLVPCGQCIRCRIARSADWTMRMEHELLSWDKAVFATLTYDEKHVPIELNKKHLQDYWKRLRKALGERKIKYFSCGEYGENFGRPHYHAIIFGMDGFSKGDEELLKEKWPFGMIKLGTVTHNSINYVAKYINKAWITPNGDSTYGSKEKAPAFQLASKGLGREYLDANKELFQRGYKKVGISPRRIPRYYKQKLGLTASDFKEEVDKQIEALRARFGEGIEDNTNRALQEARHQREMEEIARLNLKKRGAVG